jgi:signal transduction histidine kinase
VLEGFEAGASDYLAKPFAPRELIARVEAQVKLRTAALRAAENQRLAALGLLTSGFAHEVRNPLNGLLNVLAPLREIAEEANAKGAGELIDVAEECGDRIRQLTQSLLSFARPTDHITPIDLRESLEAALRVLGWQKRENVTMAREFGEIPTIEADAGALDQVWLNLLDNAFRALPDGGLLRISTEQRGASVIVAISDTGTGITPEAMSHLYEPFFSTRPAGQGSGLGLAICRRIVLRHGGELRITSTVGEGTRVEVQLPIHSKTAVNLLRTA